MSEVTCHNPAPGAHKESRCDCAEIVLMVNQPAVFFTDGNGTVWTLDLETYGDRALDMPRRTRAIALALLDVARENVRGGEA